MTATGHRTTDRFLSPTQVSGRRALAMTSWVPGGRCRTRPARIPIASHFRPRCDHMAKLQESGLSTYLFICINAPEGCQLSIYLFPTNRFIGAERPFELRVMSNHPRRAVLYSTCRSGTRATTHAYGWFHEWIHTLEYGPQWWERPHAPPTPDTTGYDTTHWFESEYLQSFSPRRN